MPGIGDLWADTRLRALDYRATMDRPDPDRRKMDPDIPFPEAEELSRDFIRGVQHGMLEAAKAFDNHPADVWTSVEVAEIMRLSADRCAAILEEYVR